LTTDRIVSNDGLTSAIAQDGNNFQLSTANGDVLRVDGSVPEVNLTQGTTGVQIQIGNVKVSVNGAIKLFVNSTGLSIGSGLPPTAVVDIVGTYPALRMRDGFEQAGAVMLGNALGNAFWDSPGNLQLPFGGLFFSKGSGPPFNIAFGAIDTPVVLNPSPCSSPSGVAFGLVPPASLQYQPTQVQRIFSSSVSVSLIGTAGDQITVLLSQNGSFVSGMNGIATMTGSYVTVSFEFQRSVDVSDILEIGAFNSTSTNSVGIGSLTWILT
jgi:hypothetical protein